MAFASVGNLGTLASSASGTTLLGSPAAQLDAGNIGIIVISSDNTSSGADGDNGEVASVIDSVDNDWVKLGEYTNVQTGAGTGVTCSVWATKAAATLTTGGTITVTFISNRTDKCASIWEFSTAAGGFQVVDLQPNATDGANGFGSSAISGLASKSRLYFRGLAKEANSTTNITPSGSFSAITAARSRNNASAVIVRGEFRINTSTGETSNPTLAVTGDTAGVFVALEEVWTGTGGLTVGATTLTASATFTPGASASEGTAALTVGAATLAGAATFAPLRTGTATLTAPRATLAASATSADPVYSGTSALTVGAATLAAVGQAVYHPVVRITQWWLGPLWSRRYGTFVGKTLTPPVYAGTANLTVGAATMASFAYPEYEHPVTRITQWVYGFLWSRRYGSFANKGGVVFTGSAALQTGAATLAASATHVEPVYTGTAGLTVGATTTAAAATFVPQPAIGTAALTAPRATLAATAVHTDPVYSGVSDLQVGQTEFAASAIFAAQVYQGSAAVSAGPATMAAAATFQVPVRTGTAALQVGRTSLAASGQAVGPLVTATGALTAPRATLTAAGLFSEDSVHTAVASLLMGAVTLSAAAAFDPMPAPVPPILDMTLDFDWRLDFTLDYDRTVNFTLEF